MSGRCLFLGELDGEASEMVFWVCKQMECAVMRSEDVANEQKTESLALGLGGEEWREEIVGYGWRYAMPVVGDGERGRRGGFDGDKSLCHSDTLDSILYDVDEHLLEKDSIKMNGYGFVGKLEINKDVRRCAHILKEGSACFHFFTEVAELQLWLRNFHYFGKA